MNIRSLLASTCAAAIALALAGCNKDSSNDASVRLVNATSDYSSLDLYDSTSAASTAIASYAAGPYVGLDAGSLTLNLESSGSGVVAASTTSAISSGDAYTVVAYSSGGSLNAQVLTDNESAPSSGTAKLRVFHTAATEAGNLDVYLTTSNCSALSGTSTSAFASNLSGLQSGYTAVTAASGGTAYHVCVTASGDKTDLRLDIPSITLANQEVATLILTRSSGGVLVHGLLLSQQSSLTKELNTSARMRMAVGASSGAAVTATANGTTLGSSLSAPAVTGYQLVTAGDLSLAVTVGGNAVAFPSTLNAAAGADLTLLVTGTSSSTPTLLTDDNTPSTSTAKPTKLRLVNGMTGTNSTATLTDDYVSIGNGAVYGAASSYALVASSAALARLEADYGSTQLCLSTLVTLGSGSVYTVFLLGDLPSTVGTCNLRADR